MTLSEFKAARGLTLTALAAHLGLPVTTVHGYLKGVRRPAAEHLPRIVEATGGEVTAAELRSDLARLFQGAA